MDLLQDAQTAFSRDGFVVLLRYLRHDELSEAVDALAIEFPTSTEFHDDVDPVRNERFRDEFGGITNFPFTCTSLSLLAVHDRLIDLAAVLLNTHDLRAQPSPTARIARPPES